MTTPTVLLKKTTPHSLGLIPAHDMEDNLQPLSIGYSNSQKLHWIAHA